MSPYSRSVCPGIFCALSALLLFACSEPPPETTEVAQPVKVFTVGAGGVATLEYPGRVSASTQADMAFEVSGKITGFPVIEGQEVTKGQLLAQLDPRDFQSTLSSAQGQFDKSDANFKRAEELLKSDFISKTDYDQLSAQRNTARADLDKARKALEDATLRAPFDGQVARKLVEDFANIQAKQPVLILHDVNQLEVEVNIPEADWALSSKGVSREERTRQVRPRVSIAGIPGQSFPAAIKEVATAADPTTRTYQAKLSFAVDGDFTVLPGMTAKVTISLNRESTGNRPQVPARAVLSDTGGKPFVWRIDANTMTVKRAAVEVGQLSGGDIEIVAGLNDGDLIAISGVHHLRDGVSVRRFD